MFKCLNGKEREEEKAWYAPNAVVLKSICSQRKHKREYKHWASIWQAQYSTNGAILKT